MKTAAPSSIVAVAARTPVGLRAAPAAAAVRAGISRVRSHPFMIDGRGEPLRMARDPRLDAKLPVGPRISALAAAALDEIEAQLGSRAIGSVELFLALPETRPGFSDADAAAIVEQLGRRRALRGGAVKLAARGHAGAVQALEMACERVARDQVEVAIALGADSYADADTIDWLESNRQLAGPGVRGGFVPGEAAGAVAVASALRGRGLTSLARVRGVGIAREARLIKTDADVLGEGLNVAIAAAIADLRIPAEAVDEIYGDINGERYRTDEWGFAALRLGQALRSTDYWAPTVSWGDVGAASAVLGWVLATRAWARGYAKGPRALVWAGSESGLRGAVVLEAPGS